MSESNQVSLIYVPESTYGTTPTDSANWKTLRFTSESMTANPQTQTSGEIRSDRMIADQYFTSLEVPGGFNGEFSATTYDDFLEAVMANTWATDTPTAGTNQLKVGTTDHSFSFEKQFNDLSNKLIAYTGMRVGQMEMSVQFGQVVTTNFTLAGNGVSTPASTLVGAGNLASATSTSPMNATNDFGTLKIDGSAVTDVCLESLSINLNNQLRAVNCIGERAPSDQKKGTAMITGSMSAYLSGVTFDWFEKSINQTEMSLEFDLTDGTNTYLFTIPRLKITAPAPQAGGLDQDVMISADFTALHDSGTDNSFIIERS